jgi:peptidoglycan/xylan/chitin deacetylase (PgdA/CDA1 family)
MNPSPAWQDLRDELTRWRDAGGVARLWLRDDDAVAPTTALERLLDISARHAAPVTLAIIPAATGPVLAGRLAEARHAVPVLHGWRHMNHAPPQEKKQELGVHRPQRDVVTDLSDALRRMTALYGERLLPLLVPPWNRMDQGLLPLLSEIGYIGVSGFRDHPAAGECPVINTHVDIIDWRAGRGGREHGALAAELAEQLAAARPAGAAVGILTHHLDHDETCWSFLERLFEITGAHPACRWLDPVSLLSKT